MYSYIHDPETGGLLLTDAPSTFSKEPRPVYASELALLGFDEYWKFEIQDEVPYMWAEANYYWYRGQRVAKIHGGSFYEKPVLILENNDKGEPLLARGSCLEPVDMEMMAAKNRPLLDVLEKMAQKRIVHYYEKYKNKIDCFYVAFSGGKDSMVLLELVEKSLPLNSFVVIFGDTGMEYPDTYELVDIVEKNCREHDVPFYRAKSHLEPDESWRLFGPPAKTLRWCCSVHKSTPQILKLREISNKNDCIGMAFVGVREHESLSRSHYKVFNYGKKSKGQYSLNPILEWTSAEIWLYSYLKNLTINSAYTKGNSRVGCLCCPMSASGSPA